METKNLMRLCHADTVAEGKYRVIDKNGLSVLVVRVNGVIQVFKNHCSHQGKRMEGGALEGPRFTCPHHAVTYDVRSGEVVYDSGFYDIEPVRTYPVIERDGDLFIDLSVRAESSTAPGEGERQG
ncbi:MAG: Rieske (2Fe-2S) protein [bacterium]